MNENYEFWTNEVEDAVGRYAICTDIVQKNKIFDKYLHVAFKKLIDNVVQRYRPDWDGHNEKEIKDDLLYTLVVNIQRYNPAIAISRGYKPNARIYCKIIIRSAIADQRVKSYKEKQNVCFNQSHEIYLNNIN
jgi:hypothetical protein